MSLRTIRVLVAAVIALLVITELAGWVKAVWSSTAATLGWAVTAGAYAWCYRQARRAVTVNLKYYLWMTVPTLAFIVVPAAHKIWQWVHTPDQTWGQRVWLCVPELVGFVLPVAILLVIFYRLGRIERSMASATGTSTTA